MTTREGRSFKTNASWSFAANLGYALAQFGMLSLLAKRETPDDVGLFVLALAITAPVTLAFSLNLRTVLATDAQGRWTFPDYVGLRLVSTVGALTVIGAIAVLGGYGWAEIALILLVGVAKAVESLGQILYGLQHKYDRLDWSATSILARGTLALLFWAIALHLTGSLYVAVLTMVGTWLTVLLVLDMARVRRLLASHPSEGTLRPRFHVDTMKKLAWMALPLGGASLLMSLTTNAPRVIIEQQLGTYELGIYAALAYAIVAGNTGVRALAQAGAPRIARMAARGDRGRILRTVLMLAGLGAALGAAGLLVAALWGEPLVTLVYTAEYAEHIGLLLWILLAATLLYPATILNYACTALRVHRAQLCGEGACFAVTVAGAIVLLPVVGLVAIPWSLATGAGIKTAILATFVVLELRGMEHARGRPAEVAA